MDRGLWGPFCWFLGGGGVGIGDFLLATLTTSVAFITYSGGSSRVKRLSGAPGDMDVSLSGIVPMAENTNRRMRSGSGISLASLRMFFASKAALCGKGAVRKARTARCFDGGDGFSSHTSGMFRFLPTRIGGMVIMNGGNDRVGTSACMSLGGSLVVTRRRGPASLSLCGRIRLASISNRSRTKRPLCGTGMILRPHMSEVRVNGFRCATPARNRHGCGDVRIRRIVLGGCFKGTSHRKKATDSVRGSSVGPNSVFNLFRATTST